MSVERGGAPEPEQPAESPQPEHDLSGAKGDQQKGKEFSGTPPPEGSGVPEQRFEPGGHLAQPIERQQEDDCVDELDPEVEAALQEIAQVDRRLANQLRKKAKRQRGLREFLKNPGATLTRSSPDFKPRPHKPTE